MDGNVSSDVIPSSYQINLEADLEGLILNGTVKIDIQITKNTNEIVLNCANLTVTRAYFGNNVANIRTDSQREILVCEFNDEIKPCKGELVIEYEGFIHQELRGLYECKRTDSNGSSVKMAVTHFQPTSARRCFPCWDHPRYKAIFNMTVTASKEYEVLSNMSAVSKVVASNDKLTVSFSSSPVMSTYLVALVIGKFDYVGRITKSGMLIRVFTPIGASEDGKFALDIAEKMVTFYDEYFGIRLSLQKMDLVAVPELSPDAMESWGLMIFRETALLVKSNESSIESRREVARIVSHELAHQWFGNLVTMSWWNELWLNEGFANFMMYLSLYSMDTEFINWRMFLEKEWLPAMRSDGLASSHSLQRSEILEIDDILESFDTITYSKGACIIRMLYEFIGPELFRKSLGIYLEKFKYSTSTSKDLWSVFDDVTNLPINEMMSSWIENDGYPLISVEKNGSILSMRQQRFTFDKNGTESITKQWIIPITIVSYSSAHENVGRVLLKDNRIEVPICDCCTNAVFKINIGSTGFYRVNYGPNYLKILIQKSSVLTVNDKIGIIDDVFSLARAGLHKTSFAMDVSLKLSGEIDYILWSCLDDWIMITLYLLEDFEGGKSAVKAFIINIYGELYERLGWKAFDFEVTGDSNGKRLLFALVMMRLGVYGHEEIVTEAKQCLEASIKAKRDIPPEFRTSVYATILSHGDMKDVDTLLQLEKKTNLLEEKLRIISAFGYPPAHFMESILEFTFSGLVRSQDIPIFLTSCARSNEKGKMVWQFIKNNWQKIFETFKGSFGLAELVDGVGSSMLGHEAIDDIQEFFLNHEAPGISQTLKTCLSNISIDTLQRDRDGPDILDFISK